MEKKYQCYNCGLLFSKVNVTREHIPPKNLFDGYPNNFKLNRLTVNSCFKCNNDYSFNDEEFRNLIGAISDKPILSEISDKTIRSVFKKSEPISKFWLDKFGVARGLTFKKNDILKFHEKNFKGIYFNQFGTAMPSSLGVRVEMSENPTEQSIRFLYWLKINFKWKHSGHPEVFKYIIQPFRDGIIIDGNDIKPLPNDTIFIAVMVYNTSHAVMCFSTKKEIKQKS